MLFKQLHQDPWQQLLLHKWSTEHLSWPRYLVRNIIILWSFHPLQVNLKKRNNIRKLGAFERAFKPRWTIVFLTLSEPAALTTTWPLESNPGYKWASNGQLRIVISRFFWSLTTTCLSHFKSFLIFECAQHAEGKALRWPSLNK